MHNFNSDITVFINQGVGYWPTLDYVFVLITSYITYTVLILILLYFCTLPFRIQDMRERLRAIARAFETVFSMSVVYIVVKALKLIIAHPRPFEVIPDITTLVHAAPLESFPSMHAALTMALAIAVLPYRKHFGHLLIAFSLVVSLSRLYVGVHYPFDIGGGLLLGYLIPKAIHRIFSPRWGKEGNSIAQIDKKA